MKNTKFPNHIMFAGLIEQVRAHDERNYTQKLADISFF